MQKKSIISIKNATVFRGTKKVFNKLSINFPLGESVAIIGPNGAGKTTLLKLITRELYPVAPHDENYESYVKIFGEERVNIWELRKHIGVVSHDFQTNYKALATGKDVVLSAYFGSVGIYSHFEVTKAQKKCVESIMVELNITSLANQQYLKLSTGQQRHLLLARALVHKPKVLIFDEPTSGLDLKSGFQLLNNMRKYCCEGTSLILVTHHISEIIPEINRVVFLKNGETVNDSKKSNLLVAEKLSELYNVQVKVGKSNGYYTVTPLNVL